MKERQYKRSLIILLIMILTVSQFTMISFAYKETEGVVSVSGSETLNVRVGGGTNYDMLLDSSGKQVKLKNGTKVTVIDEINASNGKLWFKIRCDFGEDKNLEGFVFASYISIVTIDNDFEANMNAQGFPESYKTYLRQLHTKYPEWKFVAQKTNLDWNTVIENESKIGKNLVHISSLDSWKSIQLGAFDWMNNKWIGFDGANWVPASTEIIQYYMDPRNLLDETSIFQFEQQTFQSFHTVEGVQKIFDNTFMSGTYDESGKTYAQTFMEVAQKNNMSPYMLAARCRQEMGVNGTSPIIAGNVEGYEGYYNYFNIGAYTTSSASAVINGLKYAQKTDETYFLPWNNRYKAILGGATYIANQYIHKGQDTVYLQKFNVQGNNLYNHQYMTAVYGANSEASNIKKAHNEDLNKEIIFKIPVYLNMPNAVSPKPTGTGSPNNLLSGLNVVGYQITPTFESFTTEYSLVVENNISSITIEGSTIDSKATKNGMGEKSLQVGDNQFNIEITAVNGSKKTYTLNVYRKDLSPDIPNGTITSDVFNIQDIITGITPGMLVDSFLSNISVKGESATVLNADGSPNVDIVKTNDTVKTSSQEIPIVIYGDVNGDGEIDTFDLLYVQRHILNISKLNGNYLEAADTDHKCDDVSTMDLLYMQRHILGISQITQ